MGSWDFWGAVNVLKFVHNVTFYFLIYNNYVLFYVLFLVVTFIVIVLIKYMFSTNSR